MTRLIGLTIIAVIGVVAGARGVEPPANSEKPRVPVAIVWNSDGVFVATRDGQSLLRLDPDRGSIENEWPLGYRAASLLAKNGHFLIGTDDGELLTVTTGGVVTKRLSLGRGPVRIASLNGAKAAASIQWSDAVKVVDLATGTIASTFRLPFAPGAIVAPNERQVIVADAFRESIGIIDPIQNTVNVRSLDGVNSRAVALTPDGKELLIVHMAQYASVPISQSNLDWGLVLSAKLSAIKLTDLTTITEVVARRRLNLDGSGNGAADPSALAISTDGHKVLITLAGANQLMVNDRSLGAKPNFKADILPLGDSQLLQTIEVGRSPVALAIDPTGDLVATANSMDDSVTIVRLADLSIVRTIPLHAKPLARDPIARGEALFRDGRRGFDRWMSCESCHSGGGHTNGLNFDTQGDGNTGAAKNTPGLAGVGSTSPYTWTGQFPQLADQVHQSFLSSLRGPTPDREGSEDVAAYLKSLPLIPPQRATDEPAVQRGASLFARLKCATCHTPPTYTSAGVENVGLNDGDSGHSEFNPPSLRGVGRTAPYFHDGRAATLDEVFKIHPPEQSKRLSPEDRVDLAAFLRSL